MRMDFPKETNHIRRASIVIKKLIVQTEATRPRGSCHRGERRNSVVTIPRVLDRGLPLGSPHSPPQRLQQIAAFIEKNDASLPFEALFLSAANLRGANGQWLPRSVRVLAVLAFEDSSRDCGATAAHTPDGKRRQTGIRLDHAPADQSSRPERTPSNEFRAKVPGATHCVAGTTALAFGRDGALPAGRRPSAMLASSDTLKRRWSQLPQPRPSMSCPARTTGLRLSGGLRALRVCLVVSWDYCSDYATSFPLTSVCPEIRWTS